MYSACQMMCSIDVMKTGWFVVLFKPISLLVFCLVVLFIIENGVLKFVTIIIELFLPLILSGFASCTLIRSLLFGGCYLNQNTTDSDVYFLNIIEYHRLAA